MLHRFPIRVLAAGLLTTAAACAPSSVEPGLRIRVTVARDSLRVGDRTPISAEVFEENGAIIPRRQAARLTSRDTVVATVVGSGSGTVTALAPGISWIVGERGAARDSVRITVTP